MPVNCHSPVIFGLLIAVSVSLALPVAQAQTPESPASNPQEVAPADPRPDYNGPYRYPARSAQTLPQYGGNAAPCVTYNPYFPCMLPGNTYYESNNGRRSSSGYVGYGVPDSAVRADDHSREVIRAHARDQILDD
tara:strand:+ start:10712 stop:11116 length:405 start_codon:yes stop_codon:yes gene_type:complete